MNSKYVHTYALKKIWRLHINLLTAAKSKITKDILFSITYVLRVWILGLCITSTNRKTHKGSVEFKENLSMVAYKHKGCGEPDKWTKRFNRRFTTYKQVATLLCCQRNLPKESSQISRQPSCVCLPFSVPNLFKNRYTALLRSVSPLWTLKWWF